LRNASAFAPDDHTLASADRKVRVWDVRDPSEDRAVRLRDIP
jgi:hypothetical protein